jgi:hypothetical protein
MFLVFKAIFNNISVHIVPVSFIDRFPLRNYWQALSHMIVSSTPRHQLSTSDQHAELEFYSASSLKQQSAGRHVAPHTFFWFWANHSLLFLLNDACLEEKQQIPIL